jgi:hypothetical protein
MPTPAAMSLSDVPSYPFSAKHRLASRRIASRVELASPSYATAVRLPVRGPHHAEGFPQQRGEPAEPALSTDQ